MSCRLSNLFRQLYINSRGVSTSSSHINNHTSPAVVSILQNLTNSNSSLSKELDLRFSPRNIDLGFTVQSPPLLPQINIIDKPISINRHIIEPIEIIYNKEDITSEKSIDLPTHGDIIEKFAVRMIVIRRKKMKIHKRKKFLRRTKILRQKLKSRRIAKKEKYLKVEIKYMIGKAEMFDAKKYVDDKIAELTQEIIPTTYRGQILPEATIRQFLAADKQKKEKKRNRKRLTLD
ncbi:uncharacterized protein LOC127285064 [Leptopilina boulardi]|uniref:uncharacterized protein LOC127285064 n=1 Tax=Leptopilina boulardi TaxID=63433 RepID=UPI0021F56DD8|nr:uncharacterized protein LOC127285064 [Leptopilina boulardi]